MSFIGNHHCGNEKSLELITHLGINDLIRPRRTDRPSGFSTDGARRPPTSAAAATPSTSTRSAASTARTAQIPEVDLQLGGDVVGRLAEVVLVINLQ